MKCTPVKAWAWAIQGIGGKWMLCFWARPTKRDLLSEDKPSPEAKVVRVKITQEAKP